MELVVKISIGKAIQRTHLRLTLINVEINKYVNLTSWTPICVDNGFI